MTFWKLCDIFQITLSSDVAFLIDSCFRTGFIFLDALDLCQLVSLEILYSGKRYNFFNENWTGQLSFFEGCDNFLVFIYCVWSTPRTRSLRVSLYFCFLVVFCLFLDGTDNHVCQEICKKHRQKVWESYHFYHNSPSKGVAFFHAVQYQLAYLKSLIDYIFNKISEINELFLELRGNLLEVFDKYI